MSVSASRPFGVTAIATIQLVKAGIAIVALIQQDAYSLSYLESTGYIEILNLTIGLLGVAVAAGLWSLYRWAWVLIMLLLGIDLSLDLYAYYEGVPSYIQMALNVAAVFYLNQRDVRAAFGRQPIGAIGAAERT